MNTFNSFYIYPHFSMASTLPPTPSYNPAVTVLTSNGGTAAAYKDPNSPESIMKKTNSLQVQTAVDSQFDVAQSPYHEGFQSSKNQYLRYIIIGFIIFGLVLLFSKKRLNFYKKAFVVTTLILLFLLYLLLQNVSASSNN